MASLGRKSGAHQRIRRSGCHTHRTFCAKTLDMYPRTTLSDLRHCEGQARARRGCDNVRATDNGQVKTYACLPVMGLVPASFGDGRPAVLWAGRPRGLPV